MKKKKLITRPSLAYRRDNRCGHNITETHRSKAVVTTIRVTCGTTDERQILNITLHVERERVVLLLYVKIITRARSTRRFETLWIYSLEIYSFYPSH